MNYFTNDDIMRLESKAAKIRKEVVKMLCMAKMGHPGGSLSEVEILTTLYYHILNIDPKNPTDPHRDRFVLSKGHGSPTLYTILADLGYFDKKELETFRQFGSLCTSYPDMRTPGIDMVSGSLGNGLSTGIGMALNAKRKKDTYDTYVVLGDGELQEGLVWEAAMAASYHRLSNLTAIVDCNGLQINGWVNDVMTIEPLADKWKSFGWSVIEIDGHDIRELLVAFHRAKQMRNPTAIIAYTVKGKGVEFMEDVAYWHSLTPNADQPIEKMQKYLEMGIL